MLIEARYAELVERNNAKRLALLEELTRKFPQDKRFHHELGTAYFASGGRIPESQRELEKAIELDPTFSPPTNQLAYLYKELGQYEKALQTLERYVALAPGDANPYDSMGELLLCMGKLDESIAKYQEAIRLEPKFFGARRGLTYVLTLKEDYPGALAVNQQAVDAAPTLGARFETLAWRHMYLSMVGREKERARLLEETARQAEKLPIVYSMPIRWLLAWGRDPEREFGPGTYGDFGV